MKKKALFVLSMLMLASCNQTPSASVTPSTPDVPSTTPSVVQEVKHAVSVPTDVKGVYVTASVSEAVKDEVVKVTVAMTDPSNYELKTVSVGENVLTGTKDENNDNVMHYEFTMPDADTAITVVTAKKEAPKKDHTLSFEGNGLAYAINMPGEANTNEIVKFKVAAQSGYEITKVSAKAGETDVRVTGDPITGYTMVMPDSDVTITAEALGAYFEVTADDEEIVFVPEGSSYDSNKKTVADFVGGFKIGAEVSTSTSKFIRAGTEVELIGARNAFADNVRYFANGNQMETGTDEEYLTYKFVMPAKNVELTVQADQKHINLTTENDAHITSSFYFKDADGNKTPTTSALAGQTVYIDFACTDEENFKLGTPTGKVSRYTDVTKFATSDYEISVSKIEGNTYSIIVPTVVAAAGDIVIKGPELELIYKGKEFVGAYKGYNFYSSSSASTASLNADGSAKIGSSSYTITGVDEINKTVTLDTEAKTRTIRYDGDIIWTTYDPDAKGKYTDIYAFIKAEGTVSFKKYGNISSFAIYQLSEDGVVKGTLAIDGTNKVAALNPEITMISGDDIFATGAKFVVKKNGELIKACGVGAEYGTYTNGTDTMVLDGDGKVTFNGTEGTYVISGTKVSVTIGGVTTDYTINVQEKTFTAYVVATNPFYVGTFTGSLEGSTGRSYDCTLIIKADKTGTYTYNGTTYTFSFTDADIKNGTEISFTDNQNRDVTLTIEEVNNLIAIYFETPAGAYFEGDLAKTA